MWPKGSLDFEMVQGKRFDFLVVTRIVFSSMVMQILVGIFKKQPVSSQLNTCWGNIPLVYISLKNILSYFLAASTCQFAAWPCLTTVWVLLLYLKLWKQSQLALILLWQWACFRKITVICLWLLTYDVLSYFSFTRTISSFPCFHDESSRA